MHKTDTLNKAHEQIKNNLNFTNKQTQKFIEWVLESSNFEIEDFINLVKQIKSKTNYCHLCGDICEETLCFICSDPDRDKILMVVDNNKAINKFEELRFFTGKYYIFSTDIDIEKNEELFLHNLEKLSNYAKNFDEVIIAISPNLKGEIISYNIKKQLYENKISVSQLAIGIPIGANVDFVDPVTLRESIKNRTK
ncbi:toprim domain-containing protein [Mycoplasmopsis ciconiae]|uniref:Toprim domain-containing protein n=1 Tax=Mycoplasmopsis ciconiae TaxID=561067 RepID=A0ABU7MN16_9BACT|nr:toprim domain-containing protein [Mycoplasmopsis ciconiae]